MKDLLAFVLVASIFHGTPSIARDEADTPFNTRANKVNKTSIEWVPVDNVQKACEKESHRRGLGGFGYAVEACSFWTNGITGNRCTIITAKVTNMGTLGHEARHCFQGAFH